MAVVLNFRSPHETVHAVESLLASTPPVPAIVVDNASGDESVAHLRRALPDVRILEAPSNDGFSVGCNLGIRYALNEGAARVFLLNSDAIVAPDTVAILEGGLDLDPRLGIVGPLVMEMDDPGVVQSAGIRYSAWNGRMRHYGHAIRGGRDFRRSRVVDGVSGCAMLIKREVVDAIGLLSADYFFGFEDLDWCLRARAAGFMTGCIGETTVLHHGSVSIGKRSARRVYFATRNHLLLDDRLFSTRSMVKRWFRRSVIMAVNLLFVLTDRDTKLLDGLRAFASGVRDFFSGQFGRGSRAGGDASTGATRTSP